ncbi:oxidoreductase [Actinoplanes sp. SE50]|uniref:PhzF family phenazine biosynthesis protein n=1 Tax=unclassified Actinoplanes TaxID=2626549 RepID=UPI00023EDF9B|nr:MULTISPECIES: PhzF family phenazine biosynthesis protein [unclassified Actinoplanes]AEV88321.1 Diaminopimelate epimerase [Actinoplanes sp. SE50/110]ATO86726.1 oxidoreductase [Actinoplanes sp. SE50]SLM04144.1 oxidoreductase [Actinoplanes sp. SE50/110]
MRIRIVDAFTDRPFAGNPAGVLILDGDGFPAADWMQRVAAEVNLSETAFLHRLPAGSDAGWALRWFTPGAEVALCGHATLGTTHVLHRAGLLDGAAVRYATRSGILAATVAADGLITMDFPAAPLSPVEVAPELAAALGVDATAGFWTGPNTDDILIELADEAAVRGLTPDFGALARHTRRGVAVTARSAEHDFVSRFFAPAVGVNEDPVTGSAHTALTPYWAGRLGRTELTGYQASARGGVVRVALRGDRVDLAGHAVTTIDGELQVAISAS